LKLLKAFKSDLKLIRVGESSRVVEDFNPKKRDDGHFEYVICEYVR